MSIVLRFAFGLQSLCWSDLRILAASPPHYLLMQMEMNVAAPSRDFWSLGHPNGSSADLQVKEALFQHDGLKEVDPNGKVGKENALAMASAIIHECFCFLHVTGSSTGMRPERSWIGNRQWALGSMAGAVCLSICAHSTFPTIRVRSPPRLALACPGLPWLASSSKKGLPSHYPVPSSCCGQ